MILVCEKCNAKYMVPDSAIGPAGRVVKCTSCSHTWTQYPITDGNSQQSPKPGESALPKGSSLQTIEEPVKIGFKLKAACILLFLLSVYASLLAYYPFIYKISPFAKNFYIKYGLQETKGLVLENADFRKIKKDDKYIFLIKGDVVNTSEKKLKAPDIRITLFNKSGNIMSALNYKLDKKIINPKERIAFDPKINNVPEEAETILVDVGNKLELKFRGSKINNGSKNH